MPTGGGAGVALPVGISSGGTGATTAAAALTALGAAATGSHTLKRGSAGGSYSISVTSFAAIDATNLDVTVTVPTGMLAIALFFCSTSQASGSTGEVGIAVDGTVNFWNELGGAVAGLVPNSAIAVLVGNGASHTFSPNARVQTLSANHLTIANNDAFEAPVHLVILIGAS